ncbi:tetratricopeptide repeat protein, partial [Lysinibacillus sp. D4A3_S15]|uniref:tetratricopeptide repeat protein n=1 Tax=Lysinibacillus sp. D4A3_S15 TaxID=2941227 RepID=UPI0037C605AE
MSENNLYQQDHSTDAYKHAADWFEIAAGNGDASAQYNLGARYNHGQGVKKDYTLAKMWYERAAAQNDPNAHYS